MKVVEKKYPKLTCPYCGSVFEFTQKDCKWTKQKHPSIYIDCPVCDHRIFRFSPDKENNYNLFLIIPAAVVVISALLLCVF